MAQSPRPPRRPPASSARRRRLHLAGLAGLGARALTFRGLECVVLEVRRCRRSRPLITSTGSCSTGSRSLTDTRAHHQLDVPLLQRALRARCTGAGRRASTVWLTVARPQHLFSTLFAPIGTRFTAGDCCIRSTFEGARLPTCCAPVAARDRPFHAGGAHDRGFSDGMIDEFFVPLRWHQLDRGSRFVRRFEIVLRMLATGDAAPAAGMKRSPRARGRLPEGVVRLGAWSPPSKARP